MEIYQVEEYMEGELKISGQIIPEASTLRLVGADRAGISIFDVSLPRPATISVDIQRSSV